MIFNTENVNGTNYFSSQSRGINYTLHYNGQDWELHSQRQALGNRNPGSYKFFADLKQLEDKLKAFKGISQLIN